MTFEEFLIRFQDPDIKSLRHLHAFLLASGGDPGAVLRGEAKVSEGRLFLVEKAWTDSMENEASAAFGYEPELIVATEAEAQKLVDDAGPLTSSCWAVRDRNYPARRYRPLPSRVAPPALTELRELAKQWEERIADMRESRDAFSVQARSILDATIESAEFQTRELTAALDAMGRKG